MQKSKNLELNSNKQGIERTLGNEGTKVELNPPTNATFSDRVSRTNRNAKLIVKETKEQLEEEQQEDSEDTKWLLNIVLLSLMFSGLGAHFVYDMLQGVQTPLYQIYQFITNQFQRIYSFYYLLNFFVAPLAGVLITRIGLGNGVVLFNAVLFLGISIAYIGLSLDNYPIILFGFSILGIGNENTINCQVAAVNKWFSGRYLSLAMGLKYTFSFLVEGFSDYICPELFLISRNVETCFFATGVCAFIGFCSATGFNMIDHFHGDKVKLKAAQEEDQDAGSERSSVVDEVKKSYSCNFPWKKIGKLPAIFWFSVLTYSLVNNVEAQLVHICTDMSVKKFGYDYHEAKNFIAIFKFTTLILLPVWSVIVQRFGCKVYVLILSTSVSVLSILLMIYAPSKPSRFYEGSILLLGVFFSLYLSCIWACLSISLPISAASIGLGITSSVQMVGNVVSPIVLGWLTRDRDKKAYGNALVFMLWCAVVCVGTASLLLVVDCRAGQVLNRKESDAFVVNYRDEIERKFVLDEDTRMREDSVFLTTKE